MQFNFPKAVLKKTVWIELENEKWDLIDGLVKEKSITQEQVLNTLVSEALDEYAKTYPKNRIVPPPVIVEVIKKEEIVPVSKQYVAVKKKRADYNLQISEKEKEIEKKIAEKITFCQNAQCPEQKRFMRSNAVVEKSGHIELFFCSEKCRQFVADQHVSMEEI